MNASSAGENEASNGAESSHSRTKKSPRTRRVVKRNPYSITMKKIQASELRRCLGNTKETVAMHINIINEFMHHSRKYVEKKIYLSFEMARRENERLDIELNTHKSKIEEQTIQITHLEQQNREYSEVIKLLKDETKQNVSNSLSKTKQIELNTLKKENSQYKNEIMKLQQKNQKLQDSINQLKDEKYKSLQIDADKEVKRQSVILNHISDDSSTYSLLLSQTDPTISTDDVIQVKTDLKKSKSVIRKLVHEIERLKQEMQHKENQYINEKSLLKASKKETTFNDQIKIEVENSTLSKKLAESLVINESYQDQVYELQNQISSLQQVVNEKDNLINELSETEANKSKEIARLHDEIDDLILRDRKSVV